METISHSTFLLSCLLVFPIIYYVIEKEMEVKSKG